MQRKGRMDAVLSAGVLVLLPGSKNGLKRRKNFYKTVTKQKGHRSLLLRSAKGAYLLLCCLLYYAHLNFVCFLSKDLHTPCMDLLSSLGFASSLRCMIHMSQVGATKARKYQVTGHCRHWTLFRTPSKAMEQRLGKNKTSV